MSLKVVQWNMHGYLNNYAELQLLIKDCTPDIICIQETHLPNNHTPTFAPKSYKSYFYNFSNTASQGIGILIKHQIPHSLIPTNCNILSLAIQIDLTFSLTIVNLYIPPQVPVRIQDLSALIHMPITPFLIVGDFNAWSPLWGSKVANSRGRIIEDLVLSEDIIVLNDGSPTHYSTRNTFTHVDISLSSATLSTRCNWKVNEDLFGSDHFPIHTEIHTNFQFPKLRPTAKFKTDIANWEYFKQECMKNFGTWSFKNVNHEASKITKVIRSAANKSIPQTKPSLIKNQVPWWNRNLQQLRNQKQKCWRIFKSSQTISNLIEYKKANSVFRKQLRESKRNTFQEFTSKITPLCSTHKIWSNIKSLTGIPPSRIRFIRTNNSLISNPVEIATAFADTWSNLSKDCNFSNEYILKKSEMLKLNYTPTSPYGSASYLEVDITFTELEIAISHAKGKTPGIDRISYPMIKNLPLNGKKTLIELYNTMLEKGLYPHTWLNAVVVPIPKPNKPVDKINSYRPISLLPCLAKIFEKIIAARLSWFISQNNLLSAKQTGFKKGHSTMDLLLQIQHFAFDALSVKGHATILATDFEKAFDRVGIHTVLEQLQQWNLGPKIFGIIKAFLTKRNFCVRVLNHLSQLCSLHNGIPQGSPLSAVLFTIAFDQVSKICEKYKKIDYGIYADDLFFFTRISDLSRTKDIFSKILIDIDRWGNTSGAKLSITKCKTLHICKKHNCPPLNLAFKNTHIEQLNSLKILGIIFDHKLGFKTHCLGLRKDLAARLSIVKLLASKKCQIHTNVLTNVTKALIMSKIDYGLPIYGWCAKSNLQKIYSPYHSAVRRSLNAFPTSPTRAILAEAGFSSLEERVKETTLKLVPRLMNTTNCVLFNCFKNILTHKRLYKQISALRRCAAFSKKLDILPPKTWNKPSRHPWWIFNKSAINVCLHQYKKAATSPEVYRALFREQFEKYTQDKWSFIYTDGSKTNNVATFAVVSNTGLIISGGWLLGGTSVFTAEALAIKIAIEYATKLKGNFVICTDSLSCLSGLQSVNTSSSLIQNIKAALNTHHKKINLLWVPGHAGIPGNEAADAAAKQIHLQPCLTFATFEKHDSNRTVSAYIQSEKDKNWKEFSSWYSKVNPSGQNPHFPNTNTRSQTTTFIRLRIGHILFTHEHLLTGKPKNSCPWCGSLSTVDHLLDECPNLRSHRIKIFGDIKPSALLEKPSSENIHKIYNFLKQSKSIKLI